MTKDPKENPITNTPEEKSITEEPKENSFTGTPKEKSITENARENPLIEDLQKLQDPQWLLRRTKFFWLFCDGNGDKFSQENFGFGKPRFHATVT